MLKYFKIRPKNERLFRNIALFGGGVFILMTGIIIIWLSSLQIPDFQSFDDRKTSSSTKIYDRTGEVLLYDIYQDTRKTDIGLDQMGENIKEATLAIEDSEFYNHQGVRITSTTRAILSNIFGFGIGGGGSTITQQLVKNSLLTPKRSPIRKVKEWVLAYKIDRSMPKDKILEYYLNDNPYGGTIYGVQEASKSYFNKDAKDLTIAEAAYLAAIPQAPSLLSPYGRNRDRLDTRKNLVLSRMRELKFITEEEYQAAKNEAVAFAPQAKVGIKAPHFVFFVKDYLEQKYGADMVLRGGLRVISSLDYTLQEKGEQFVKEGALENDKLWDGENAGLVAIDPKTGQILTMVGSRDYFDKDIDGNYNTATALRQPGSAFKPFIYATAFNKGFTPETVLFDLPTEFNASCTPDGKGNNCYSPGNYDGKFRGPMSLRNALAQSINVPAVKLFYLAGLSDSQKVAEDLGITTLGDIERYGLTLVIGGGEVSLVDITSAYGVFANNGIRNPYTPILRIENARGEVIEEFKPEPIEVLPKATALTLSDVLKDNTARTPTFGANSVLNIPGAEVAVKTGTTNSNRDAWTVGYTPGVVVGVWAGNNNNTPMKKGGASIAGPIWNKFMKEAIKVIPPEPFEAPVPLYDPSELKPVLRGHWQGNESFTVDMFTGGLATEFTPPEMRQERVLTNVHTILHWIDRDNIMGPPPANPENNPQYKNWEASVRSWWGRNGGSYPGVYSKPTTTDTVHTDGNRPIVIISEPNSSTVYTPDQRVNVSFTAQGPYPIQKVDIFVNGMFQGSFPNATGFSFSPRDIQNLQAINEVRVIAYDSASNKGEAVTTFRVSQ